MTLNFVLGTEEIKQLAAFYREEAEVEFQNETFRFPPIIDRDVLLSEWPIFKRVLHHEMEALRVPCHRDLWSFNHSV